MRREARARTSGPVRRARSPAPLRRLLLALAFSGAPGIVTGAAPGDTPAADLAAAVALPGPGTWSPAVPARPLALAVVDDGVLVEHPDLAPFIRPGPGEIAGNGLDDDANGYVDDAIGWDAADADPDPRPPPARLDAYAHGTHLAGVIARVLRAALGPEAERAVRILPVKAVADDATHLHVAAGYAGIRYAIDAGADIVLSAWGAGPIAEDERAVLDAAERAGVTVVAAAGNFGIEQLQFPAAHPAVIAVAALGRDGAPLPDTSHGSFVDLSAPGEAIAGSAVGARRSEAIESGTSQAAAIVAAAAALVRLAHPTLDALGTEACLVNHAGAFDGLLIELAGKLGAGRLDVGAAIACPSLFDAGYRAPTRRPRGIWVARAGERVAEWRYAPRGRFEGLRVALVEPVSETPWSGTLEVFAADDATPTRRLTLDGADARARTVVLPPTTRRLRLLGDAGAPRRLLRYRAETIDFTREHCEGLQRVDAEGFIEDGSGPRDYAYHSDCKWLIVAPPGHRVELDFLEMDTEERVDLLHVFDGDRTSDALMAMYSGHERPPRLTSWGERVLLWFVSDRHGQFGGWRARVRFVPAEDARR